AKRRLTRLLCVMLSSTLMLVGCDAGFDPGIASPGARCMWTVDGPGTTNFFSYTPDCPGLVDQLNADGWSVNDGWGPNHWTYVVFKGCSHNQQNGAIGLVDLTSWPGATAGDLTSRFQTAWVPYNNGYTVEMQLQPGSSSCDSETDFDIENSPNGGLAGLHSHHEVAMVSNSGNYQTAYALSFKVGTEKYWLSYALSPKNPLVTTPGSPPGVAFHGCGACDGHDHLIIVNATYFGTPKINNGWTNVDIDWQGLLNYVQRQGLWTDLDVNTVTYVTEVFESAGYGASAGGVDTIQKNWRMSYR
ncbi:MAG TPA: hypothetical protein VFR41_08025, partial [Acidimicrobiia bacterium]|nr:hypothetical protein [Acidimicrobiia bacterium]